MGDQCIDEAMVAGALTTAVRLRDPDTAGHQERTAAIARRIADRLGLPEEECLGIYLGALIHDVGKLGVPLEVLHELGDLRPASFEVIRCHPGWGLDVLAGVAARWPLDQIVYQHHERLNGSGYPQALRGQEILPAARIVAVADVVDSMTTDRPYRRAPGRDAALQALSEGRGLLLDPDVIDAYLALEEP